MPASRTEPAKAAGGLQTFRSPTAVLMWWVWLLFAAANLVDLAVQGRDHFSLIAAAILVLVTGIAYVTAQRPRIIADDAGITVRNPLRDHHVGWARVTRIDVADLLRVHCDPGPGSQRGKVISAWAVHHSRRQQLLTESRARRANERLHSRRSSPDPPYGVSGSYGDHSVIKYGDPWASPGPSAAEAEAEKIVRILSEHATAARAEAVWAAGAGQLTEAEQASAAQAGEQASAAQGAEQATGGTGDQARDAAGPGGGDATKDLSGTGWLEPLKSTWSRPAIAALIIPALILLVVCLV